MSDGGDDAFDLELATTSILGDNKDVRMLLKALVGQLAEIGADDLAFSVAEVGKVLARHGITLPASWLEFLTRRTQGWAAGTRLAALSVCTHTNLGLAPPGVPDQAAMLLVEPLTKREREVLHHYSSLFSRAEVASEMHLSVNTVKSHLKSIYRKLATTRRSEAVRRARQLDLILLTQQGRGQHYVGDNRAGQGIGRRSWALASCLTSVHAAQRVSPWIAFACLGSVRASRVTDRDKTGSQPSRSPSSRARATASPRVLSPSLR